MVLLLNSKVIPYYEGKLLATSYINMMNFEHGETKTFTGLVDINVGQVKQYRIQYESGF